MKSGRGQSHGERIRKAMISVMLNEENLLRRRENFQTSRTEQRRCRTPIPSPERRCFCPSPCLKTPTRLDVSSKFVRLTADHVKRPAGNPPVEIRFSSFVGQTREMFQTDLQLFVERVETIGEKIIVVKRRRDDPSTRFPFRSRTANSNFKKNVVFSLVFHLVKSPVCSQSSSNA